MRQTFINLAKRIELGNLPQWISAASAVSTAIIAAMAFNSPAFQNQILKEENAKLHIEHDTMLNMIEEYKSNTLKYACYDFFNSFRIVFDGMYTNAEMNDFDKTHVKNISDVVSKALEHATAGLDSNQAARLTKLARYEYIDDPMKNDPNAVNMINYTLAGKFHPFNDKGPDFGAGLSIVTIAPNFMQDCRNL